MPRTPLPAALRAAILGALCVGAAATLLAADPETPGPAFWKWALTPPLGWNSYDAFGDSVTEAEVMANAAWLQAHLLRHGYEYVVVDYRWYDPGAESGNLKRRTGARLTADRFGRLLPAVNRFPSAADGRGFRALSDRIHRMGLKFGIHVMRGIPRQAVLANTLIEGSPFTAAQAADTGSICTWNPDMYGVRADTLAGQAWYDSLLRLYASWKVDYIKVDDLSDPYSSGEIECLRRAIDRCGRPIVFSLSPGPAPLALRTHVALNANLWRISSDFWDNWSSLDHQFDLLAAWGPSAGPGHWPDADMIPFGHLGVRCRAAGPSHWTHLTHDEQRTLMSLWSLESSPLMLGADLPDNDAWTEAVLGNDEVLAVDQDRRGEAAAPIEMYRGGIWVKRMDDGSTAIGFFNRTEAPVTYRLDWANAGLSGSQSVRDLWEHRDLGVYQGTLEVEVPPHGARLYRFRKASPDLLAGQSLPPILAPQTIYDAAPLGRRVHEPTVIEGTPGVLVLAFLDYAPTGGHVPADMDSGNTIRFMRSTDGGRTWSAPWSFNHGYTINPGWVRGASGDLWLFYDRKNSDLQDDNALWYTHTTDNGLTWSESKPIPSPSHDHILVHNGIRMANGHLLIPYAYDRGAAPFSAANYDWVVGTLVSADQGRNWASFGEIEMPNLAGAPNIKSFSAEPVVIQEPDGNLRMLLRSRSHFIYQATSPDGRTWSDARPTSFSNPDAKISAITLKDGNIVLIWNNTQVFDYTENRNPLMASLSTDGGRTWPCTITVSDDPVPLHYPTLIEYQGRILVFYGWDYRQIREVSFLESDLLHAWTPLRQRLAWRLQDGIASMTSEAAEAPTRYPWRAWTKLVDFLPDKTRRHEVSAEFRWDGISPGSKRGAIAIFSDYQDEDNWMAWVCQPAAETVGIERQEHFGRTSAPYWRSEHAWTQNLPIQPGAWYRVTLEEDGVRIRWEFTGAEGGASLAAGELPISYPGHFVAVGTLDAKASFRDVRVCSLSPRH